MNMSFLAELGGRNEDPGVHEEGRREVESEQAGE